MFLKSIIKFILFIIVIILLNVIIRNTKILRIDEYFMFKSIRINPEEGIEHYLDYIIFCYEHNYMPTDRFWNDWNYIEKNYKTITFSKEDYLIFEKEDFRYLRVDYDSFKKHYKLFKKFNKDSALSYMIEMCNICFKNFGFEYKKIKNFGEM